MKELKAAIVKSGTWMYGDEVEYEVWIVKQNFQYEYEEEFDESETLNQFGHVYKLLYASNGSVIGSGQEYFSLGEAISGAETILQQGINWDDHRIQELFGGRKYSLSNETEK